MKLIAALALLAACSPPPDLTPVPGQGLFTVIIWNDVYGRKDKAPPIEWRRDLTCTVATGFPGYDSDGQCVDGNWFSGNWFMAADEFVSVADIPGMRISETGMVAHEFLHVKLYLEGRDDPKHLQPEWENGGLMDQANAAAAAAGW